MVEKKLILTIFLVILQNVSSDLNEAENGLQRNVRRPSRGSYKYNHPPASEEHEFIPVTVVQEKVQIRTGKAVESEIMQNRVDKVKVKSTTTSTTTIKPTTSESKSTPEIKKYEITTYRPPQARNKDDDKEIKSKTASAGEIPVAMIYEEKIKPEEKSLTKESKKSLVESSQEKKTQSSPMDIKEVNKTDKEPSKTIAEDNIDTKEKKTQIKAKDVPERSDNSQNKKKVRERDPVVPIVDMESYIYSHTGEFKYSYEGGDGTKAFETGELKTFGEEKTGESVSGGFSYKDKDGGNDISLTYTADENGYRPVGAHLPTPPPIPPAIARALKYLATKTTPEPVTKPSKTPKESKKEDIKATTESVKASKS